MADFKEKILYYQEKLKKDPSSHKLVQILERLDRIPITLELLQETGIGKTVNTFRKHEQAGNKVRDLVQKWKQQVDLEKTLIESPKKVEQKTKDHRTIKCSELLDRSDKHKSQNYNSDKLRKSEKYTISDNNFNLEKKDKYKNNYEKVGKCNAETYKSPKDSDNEVGRGEGSDNDSSVDAPSTSSQQCTLTVETIYNERYDEHEHRFPVPYELVKKETHRNKLSKDFKSDSAKVKHKESKDDRHKQNSEINNRQEIKSPRKVMDVESFTQNIMSFEDCLTMGDSTKKIKKVKLPEVKKIEEKHRSRSENHSSKSHTSKEREKSKSHKSHKHSDSKSHSDKQKDSSKTHVDKHKDSKSHTDRSKDSKLHSNKSKDGKSSEKSSKEHMRDKGPSSEEGKRKQEAPVCELLTKKPKFTEIDILSTLPAIQPDYKPLPHRDLDYYSNKKKVAVEDPSKFTTSRSSRTQVFSGRKIVHLTEVPSLYDVCIKVLIENIDSIECVGMVPFDILRPVLDRCTAQQLYTLEDFNSHLVEDTDVLWQTHCNREFRGCEPDEMESWRELYLRKLDEREARFKSITANIQASMHKANPVRATKLAYVDGVVKPPRDVRRKQAKHGTGNFTNNTPKPKTNLIAKSRSSHSSSSSSQMVQEAPPSMANTNIGNSLSGFSNSGIEKSYSSSNRAQKTIKVVAPMMQKVRKMMKTHFRR